MRICEDEYPAQLSILEPDMDLKYFPLLQISADYEEVMEDCDANHPEGNPGN